MEAILNIYNGCESEKPIKTFICRRLTVGVGAKIEILSDKIFKLNKKREKMLEDLKNEIVTEAEALEGISQINKEQEDLTIETLKSIFPSFTDEDFNGLDPEEYQEFVNIISAETSKIVKRAAKN